MMYTEDCIDTLLLFLKRIKHMEEKKWTKIEHKFPKSKKSFEFAAQTNKPHSWKSF